METSKVVSTRTTPNGHRVDTVHVPTSSITLDGKKVQGPTLIQEVSYRPDGDGGWRWYCTCNVGEL